MDIQIGNVHTPSINPGWQINLGSVLIVSESKSKEKISITITKKSKIYSTINITVPVSLFINTGKKITSSFDFRIKTETLTEYIKYN
jgi:hypothetical protein